MKILDSNYPYCYPIYNLVDIDRLNLSVNKLLHRLNVDVNWIWNKLEQGPATTINITHLSELTGTDRWLKFNGNHDRTLAEGADEKMFTTPLEELSGLYIKDVMDDIFLNHKNTFGDEFYGRCQLIASKPTFGYRIHRDLHCKHRYHIPLITDDNFYFMFKEQDDMSIIHMPADGRIWYLNPKDIMHTIMHLGRQPRLHILLTS